MKEISTEVLRALAEEVAQILGTEVDEVYGEDDVTDAGFGLKNGYGIQYSPCFEKPFAIDHLDDEGLTELGRVSSLDEVREFFSQMPIQDQ